MNLDVLRRRLAARRGDLSQLEIAVLTGGTSAEREVALVSGQAVARALTDGGYSTLQIEVSSESMIPPTLLEFAKAKRGLIFTTMHGTLGEDGTYQGLLNLLRCPYVSADVRGSALAMDKLISKQLFQVHDIPTPRWWLIRPGDDSRNKVPAGLSGLVAKPIAEGSSVGIELVSNDDSGWAKIAQLNKQYNPLLIEERIEGRELTIGIIGHEYEPIILPPVEISPREGFYDYEAKYTQGRSEYSCPAKLDVQTVDLIQGYAEMIYREFGLAPFARIDCLLDKTGKPWFLEANTLPGFTPLSLLPMAANAAGINFLELLELLMLSALERHEANGGKA